MAGRPNLPGELRQRHRALVTPRGGMPLGQDHADQIAEQTVPAHTGRARVRLVLPLVGQDQVHVAQRERGQRLLGLGLHELATQGRRVPREGAHGRDGQSQRSRLERRDPAPPRHAAHGLGQLGLRQVGPVEQRLGVAHEHERGVGETHAAPGPLEQGHARLALEHGQLLRHGGGRELQRVGHRGDRAALVQLVEQAQAAQIEH